MAEDLLTLGDAARAIGVSQDTLRRWDRAGKIRMERDGRNQRLVPRSEVERLADRPRRHRAGDALSARNRFPGIVRSVEVDGVMALIEIEAGPHLDNRRRHPRRGGGAWARAGRAGDGRGQGDVGDDREGTLLKEAGVVVLTVLVVAACGSNGDSRPRLVVSAASSLTEALTSCGREFSDADVRLQFAGSDELAAQIRRGVRPDVFAAANTKLPDELRSEGLLGEPIAFATNELVLAVPAAAKDVRTLGDLRKPGTTIAMGSESVPVGAYTREVLSRLPAAASQEILGNVRSEEPDVKGVIGKLTQRAVDAGFVYESDVAATDGRLTAIPLAERLRPSVAYGAGVVTGTKRGVAARRYLEGLV